MHIALFSPGWPADGFASGIVTYVHEMRRELLRQGHDVSVLANAVSPGNTDKGIYRVETTFFHRLRRKLARGFRVLDQNVFQWGYAIAATANAVHKIQPIDVLEMEESFGWCASVQKAVPFPVVARLHGPAFLTQTDQGVNPLTDLRIEREGQALGRMKAITSPSRDALAKTASRYRLVPSMKAVIVNPISPASEWPLWDLALCDKKLVLFIGRFDLIKGGDVALLAFRQLLDVDPALKLVFVGPDVGLPGENGGHVDLRSFVARAFAERQRAQISYCGSLPRSEISLLRTKALITLVPSRWESCSYTALEAMVQGCPVVASNAGGLSEMIEDGATGLLAPPGDAYGLCAKLTQLLRDPFRASALGVNARRAVIDMHSVAKLVSETLGFYRTTIEAAEAARSP